MTLAIVIAVTAVAVGGAAVWFTFGGKGDPEDLVGQWEGTSQGAILRLEVDANRKFVYRSLQRGLLTWSESGTCRGTVEGSFGGFRFIATSPGCEDFTADFGGADENLTIRAEKSSGVVLQRKR
jgi:hypothetical protein